MPTAMPFRAEPLPPRGDKPVWVGAYCANPNRTSGQPVTLNELTDETPDASANMKENAASAAAYLKTLAHEGRLMILCHLGDGEKSVGQLEDLLQIRQAAVSQMLARLREENLVSTRRDGKTIYYSLADGNTRQVIGLLYELFCKPAG